ncbi:MAG: hypothetical protein IBV52_08425 [Candidatus Bathyarchaeota archaeon]
MVVQLFMSHTKLDKTFCNMFDVVAARVGIKVFRSEFEEIKPPAWDTIKEAMDVSSAMFLLVGKELVKAQEDSEKDPKLREDWKHTQNWIAYEIGLACAKGIDVWVYCDNVKINFPVPYLNNYAIYGSLPHKKHLNWLKYKLNVYAHGGKYLLTDDSHRKVTCPNVNCKATFNLHSIIPEKGTVTCPTCLKTMVFANGFLLKRT